MNPENMQSERPTPETDEEERIDNGETQPILEFARRLERERDEAREKLKATRKLLEDANRGAEWNAHINNSLAGKLNEAQKEIKSMREAIKEAYEALDDCLEDSGELLAEHDWWKDEPRCGYQERYNENKQRIEKANAALAKLQPFLQ